MWEGLGANQVWQQNQEWSLFGLLVWPLSPVPKLPIKPVVCFKVTKAMTIAIGEGKGPAQ